MKLLQVMFSILWGLGYLGNGILFLYVEWSFLRQSFVQVLNPLLHLQVFGVLLTNPLFWVFLAMAVVGYYAATSIDRSLEQSAKRTKINAEKVIPPSQQTFQERQPSPSFSSAQSEQTNSHISPRPFSKPVSGPTQPSQSWNITQAKKVEAQAQVRQRPHIKCHVDELERIATSGWDSIKILSEIHNELKFRRPRKKALNLRESIATRLTQLQGTQFPWSTTTANTGTQSLSSDAFPYEEGLLRQYGYRVGMSGLLESERWEILDTVFLHPLLQMANAAYLSEWGEPKSAKRLQKLADSIAAFTRNAKRRNRGSFSKAIQDWEADLAYLKRTYYNNRFSFQYPHT